MTTNPHDDDSIRRRAVTMLERTVGSAPIARDIERELFRIHGTSDAYRRRVRTIAYNLGASEELRRSVITGSMTCEALCRARREDIAPPEVREARAEASKRAMREACGIRPEDLCPDVGMIECRRCHSKRTVTNELQTRSGDEGMTVFVNCMRCGKRWKM